MTLTFRSKTKQGWTIDAPFTAFTFPGGEPHIKIDEVADTKDYQYQIADLRGADSHELITLAMWGNLCALRDEKKVLILPYLPGARADRGVPFGASVYSWFILDAIFPHQIITLDPHSPVMPAFLGAGAPLTVFPFERIIKRELGDRGDYYRHPYVGVIAPDKGAVDRAQRAAGVLNVPVFKAEKTRDFETGQLTGFTCEELPAEGKLLVVDDICDGGGTFIGLAKELGTWTTDRLDLWVTHGIFSKGLGNLKHYYNHIYTTDSFPHGYGPASPHATVLTVFRVLPYLTGEINV